MELDIDLVLVAVDSSDKSEEAGSYAVALADRYDADLHLLHFVDHRMMQGIETGDVPPGRLAETQQAMTDSVREKLPDDGSIGFSCSGTTGFSEQRLGQTPGNTILDAADQVDADFLVVPRVTPTGEADEVIGKAALHVLEYASQPVLSV